MKVATLTVLCLVTSTACFAIKKPKISKEVMLERVAVYATAEFDAASTYHAIHSCPTGFVCRESNPFMRPIAGSPAIFPIMAGSAWAVDYLARKVSPGHPRIGRVIRWVSIGGHLAAGISNVR